MPSASGSDRAAAPRVARTLIWAYLLALLFLHQDFWLRDEPGLILGVLPATLAYHMAFTILAASGWFAVTRWAWPEGLEEEGGDEGGGDRGGGRG